MVQFGKRLQSEQNSEYKGYYIDYYGLELRVKELSQLLTNSSANESIDQKVEQFLKYLDSQISIAALFYEELVDEIGQQIIAIRRKWEFLSPQTMPFLYQQTKNTAKLISQCLAFHELNTEGTRKILKKAEKLTNHSALNKDKLLIDMLRPDKLNSRLLKLKLHSEMYKLIDEIQERINTLRGLEQKWSESRIIDKTFTLALHRRQDTQELVDNMYSSASKNFYATQWYNNLLNQANLDYENELIGISNNIGIVLNNLNTFIYMINSYIVVPTANQYSAAVGLSEISSGYLLAMTPLSSLIASLVYTLWSNKSFKLPIVFCSLFLCIGNLLYAIALNYNSPTLLFIGRIIVGFGNNRAVNRRYIADFVPYESRMFHSTLFVAIGALGMSLGPGLQPLLSLVNFKIPTLNWVVNDLTSPGWLLFFIWAIFSILVTFFFSDPERKYALKRDDKDLKHLFPNENVSKYSNWKSYFEIFSKNLKELNITGISICVWIYFLLKFTQESAQSSAPLVTSYYFEWTYFEVSYLLGLVGLVILPLNISVGWISKYISDRIAQLFSIVGILLGCAIIIVYNYAGYTLFQYISGFTIIILSAQLLEGINMGLLSKVMPKSLSIGLFNSGFVSTISGTWGRVFGSTIISLAGINGMETLQNLVIFPSIILQIITIIIILFSWETLVPSSTLLSLKNKQKKVDKFSDHFKDKDTALTPLLSDKFGDETSLDNNFDPSQYHIETNFNQSIHYPTLKHYPSANNHNFTQLILNNTPSAFISDYNPSSTSPNDSNGHHNAHYNSSHIPNRDLASTHLVFLTLEDTQKNNNPYCFKVKENENFTLTIN